MIEVSPDKRLTLKEVNRHPWVVAGGKGEMDLEDPMMEVVQTHIIPSNETIDADVFQVLENRNIRQECQCVVACNCNIHL